ncbi:uncharacterized protein LY89DRAFT_688424 [Mollisia scopiformis]|uniref:Uncharacterized protein n=1 Tax=Mollisia scopiformis TaxID=149040 RepID=A0A194WWI4_MOLSC|nr:uncharacterized protein LY89DRAFT_688424 [Mollisia scopiformis]KUJ11942.1 hypothetical protein LY89DRAFT_688424 [Mollisia scopiformis]
MMGGTKLLVCGQAVLLPQAEKPSWEVGTCVSPQDKLSCLSVSHTAPPSSSHPSNIKRHHQPPLSTLPIPRASQINPQHHSHPPPSPSQARKPAMAFPFPFPLHNPSHQESKIPESRIYTEKACSTGPVHPVVFL